MAPTVYTPVEGFTGTVVGVHFRDGAGETEDPAALGYFQSAGYRIDDEAVTEPPAGTPLTPEELARIAEAEAAREQGGVPATPADPETPQGAPTEPQGAGAPKRPYPQANKAEWFAYLEQVKPGHGLTIEATKNEIIAAVDAQ